MSILTPAAHTTSMARGLRTPLVIAHRGASYEEPEHTLGAYARAIAAGADGLECDVRLSLDKHLVCVHDSRVNRTSNGKGLVSSMELTELEGLDWASWKEHAESSPNVLPDEVPDRNRGQLLTLTKLLEVARDAPCPLSLSIETKHPSTFGAEVEVKLFELLARFGLVGHPSVRVMSFSPRALRDAHRLSPATPLVPLMDKVRKRWETGTLPPGSVAAGISIDMLKNEPAYCEVLSRRYPLHVWTVDEPEDIALCLERRVGAIITNRPDLALSMRG